MALERIPADIRAAGGVARMADPAIIEAIMKTVTIPVMMDSWPLFMTSVCQQVKRIRIARVQDVSPRRGPFQKKIGAGCTPKEFEEKVASGTLRHMGLAESVAMIPAGLGWEIDDINESIEPVMAETNVKTDYVSVSPGQAAGVKQIGRGIRGKEDLITLEFVAYVGAPESYDAVYITGTPNMEW